MRAEVRMSQQLVMTPQLQQAIKLLQMSRMELTDLVRDQLLENPMLEESQELGTSTEEPVSSIELQDSVEHEHGDPTEQSSAKEERSTEVKVDEQPQGDFDWEAYLENSAYPPNTGPTVRPESDLPSLEATLSRPETLEDHLMWQIRLSNFGPKREEIAEYIVRCLDGNGYLEDTSVIQIARQLGSSPLVVEQVLRRVQQLDPLSVGARSLAECLWLQAHHPDRTIQDPLVLGIIAKHLHNLEVRKYNVVVRDVGETLEEVYEATKVVMTLDPRPARAYSSESPAYIVPDVYILRLEDDFVVVLNDDGLPRLKISNLYRSTMGGGSSKTKDYINERLRSAQWLIRSIQQRQRTILKVARSILKFQREFFEKGVQFLRPLILRDVAEDIEMHESTVSRVTTNKYVHTPQGIFELKYFFNAGISHRSGDELASEAVKIKIKNLIDREDPKKPLSDAQLVKALREEGISIARRTVAKYREQLGVLSSTKRRKLF
ncbi:MAG: RNA polymerase factor sigma-54 [Nannocystaceae bacterium]